MAIGRIVLDDCAATSRQPVPIEVVICCQGLQSMGETDRRYNSAAHGDTSGGDCALRLGREGAVGA